MSGIKENKFFIRTTADEMCDGYQLHDGLNIKDELFYHFSFFDVKHIFNHLEPFGQYVYLREVFLPNKTNSDIDESRVRLKKGKYDIGYECDKIILGKRMLINNLETFKYLISLGADIKKSEYYVVIWAARMGYLEILKYLISVGNINKEEHQWVIDNSLQGAAYFNRMEIFDYLMSLGGNPLANNDLAFQWAAEHGNVEMVDRLIKLGAKVDTNDNYALKKAARNGHIGVIKILFDNGVDIKTDQNNALSKACCHGHLHVVIFLVENGADINDKFNDAINKASKKQHIDIVKYLVGKGTNVVMSNGYHHLLNSAIYRGHTKMVEYYISIGATKEDALECSLEDAKKFGYNEVIDLLDKTVNFKC